MQIVKLGKRGQLLRFVMFYIYLKIFSEGVNRMFYCYDLFLDVYRFQGENIVVSKIY